MLIPAIEAGTIFWGFKRDEHQLCDILIAGGVKSPPAKWFRLI